VAQLAVPRVAPPEKNERAKLEIGRSLTRSH